MCVEEEEEEAPELHLWTSSGKQGISSILFDARLTCVVLSHHSFGGSGSMWATFPRPGEEGVITFDCQK